MHFQKRLVVSFLALVAACGGSADGPAAPNDDDVPDASVAVVADPTGDTFETTGVQWDVTELRIERGAEDITVRLELSRDVISPAAGDPLGLIAVLDLDLDQNPATGGIAVVDEFRRDGGSTGLGVDAVVSLSDFVDGTTPVVDGRGVVTGRVRPVFEGRHVTVTIPRALLGNDDGYVNAAAIVGITGRPTDIAPNAGRLSLIPPASRRY
jgi:hypothetical protein